MVLRKAQKVVRRPLSRTLIVVHRASDDPRVPTFNELDILRDLMLGGRHSRRTVARYGVSLPTADRWLLTLWKKIPNVWKVRDGKTTWFEYRATTTQEASGIPSPAGKRRHR